ncbi:hypothetical protein BH09PSE6_BH09PSE6_16370 [soil metagenome]
MRAIALACVFITACTSPPPVAPPAPPPPPPAPVVLAPPPPLPFDSATINVSIRTENALFKSAKFTDLPGWRQDDLAAAWPAFIRSCRVLVARDNWRDLCQRANTATKDNASLRAFFEREFVLLSITNTDTTFEGDVTGYYEPLVAGSLVRTDTYSIPVHGRPTDLYVFDWRKVPAAQRSGVIRVRASGNELVPAKAGEAGTLALDWKLFVADTRERKLRTRLDGDQVLPYWSRQQIVEQQLGTPTVLAWVQDPLALYAMQIQGAGRIQLPDQSTLRLAFAEQNGQPFRPVRVASKAPVVTRSLRAGAASATEEFTLEEPLAEVEPAVRTRGLRASATSTAPAPAPAVAAPTANPEVDALVAALTPRSSSAPAAPTKAAPAKAPAVTAAAPSSLPSVPSASAAASASAASPATTSPLLTRLSTDPSYVFFRVADDIPAQDGPIGALGVSLTPERSVAVDPRATPIGYPLYIAAKPSRGAAAPIQRMVVAQDTGGAIRGAVRADYFWGYGRDAGRRATGTELRGRMWVMIPRPELPGLIASSSGDSSAPRTRSLRAPAAKAPSTCLVADDTYCSDD